MMSRLKLTVNETKTQVCQAAGREVRLSGVHVRALLRRRRRACLHLGTRPSKKRVQPHLRGDHRATDRTTTYWIAADVVGVLNRMLIGWANYFCLGPVSKAYSAVDQHTSRTGCVGGCATSTRCRARGYKRFPEAVPAPRRWAWSASPSANGEAFRGRKHEAFSESRMREIRPSGSMSGTWKRSMAG